MRIVSLVSAVALLLTGAVTAVEAGDRVVGSMLMAAGMTVLGVWIALEVMHELVVREPPHRHDDDRGTTESEREHES
jgi:hypothetical protein